MKTEKEDVVTEFMQLQIKAYNKGFNDSLDGVISAFNNLKGKPVLQVLDIDTIVRMLNAAKEEGNKIATTYDA